RVVAGPAVMLVYFKALPADVREHRDRHRFRAYRTLGAYRARDRASLPSPVRRGADATSGRADGVKGMIPMLCALASTIAVGADPLLPVGKDPVSSDDALPGERLRTVMERQYTLSGRIRPLLF